MENENTMREVWENTNWSEQLWRYFKVERFVQTLETSRLYFAAPTQFADKFEGARAVMPPDFPVDPRYAEMDHAEKAFFALKKLMKINCWHRADYESDAMWKLYAEQSKGVALCSTPERIRAAITPFRLDPKYKPETIWFGAVDYYDLMKVRLKFLGMKAYFCKHQAFSWEREFRLLISLEMASEFGVNTPDLGVDVEINLDTLVERIMLGPELSDDERKTIIAHSQKVGLGDRVCKSSLLGQPRFY
jgi:hypothetical protein